MKNKDCVEKNAQLNRSSRLVMHDSGKTGAMELIMVHIRLHKGHVNNY
jgi:hypothetical protein